MNPHNHPLTQVPYQNTNRMQTHEMIPYETPSDNYADPTPLIGVFLLYVLLFITYQEVPQYKVNKEDIEGIEGIEGIQGIPDILETPDKHQDIITNSNSTPPPQPQSLQAAITDLLQKNTRGLSCKQIVTMLSPTMPDLTRKDLNTILYKMKVKKVIKLRSNFEKVPAWLLTPAS